MSHPRIPRRLMLSLTCTLGLALVACVLPAYAADAPATTLKQAYANDFLVGTAVNDDIVSGKDAASQALVLKHFNAITLENAMKAEVVHPLPDQWDFRAADAFVDFGRKHHMFIVGHTLVWHNQTPEWFFEDAAGKPLPSKQLAERMRQYIAKVAGIVRMVKMLKAHGIRIDGVGIQGHWGLDYPSLADIEAAIDAYAAAGVKVSITELDVDVLPLTKEGQIIGQGMTHPQFQLPEFKKFLDPYRDGLPAAVQQQLTDRYAELFALFHRERDKLERVSVWGVTDDMSWKNGYPIPDRTNYPLLFDRNHQPKPALDAVLAVPLRR